MSPLRHETRLLLHTCTDELRDRMFHICVVLGSRGAICLMGVHGALALVCAAVFLRRQEMPRRVGAQTRGLAMRLQVAVC